MSHWKHRKTIINTKTLTILVNANVDTMTYLSNYEARFQY